MKKIHKISFVVLLLCFLFILISCGKKNNNKEDNNTSTITSVEGDEDTSTSTSTSIVECTVTFKIDWISYTQSYPKGSKIPEQPRQSLEGYEFDGWYLGNKKWDFDNDVVEDNMTLVAKFIKITYTVSISSNDDEKGTVSKTGSDTYDLNDEVTIKAEPIDGHLFVHWYDNTNKKVVSTSSEYKFNITSNVDYLAVFEDEEPVDYTVNYYFQNILNRRYKIDNELSFTSQAPKNSYLSLNAPEVEGFRTPESQRKKINTDGSTTYDFYYERLSFNLSLDTNIEKDEISFYGDTRYKYGQEVTIQAEYSSDVVDFNGWYNGDKFVSYDNPYTFTMPAENLTLTANCTQKKYKLTYESLIPGVRVSCNLDEYVEAGTSVKLRQTGGDYNGISIVDWTRSDDETHSGMGYSFEMPENSIHVIMQTDQKYFILESSSTGDANYYFGSYPQTEVTDSKIKTKLNNIAGTPSTNSNWISYGYYKLSKSSNYMYYIDIDIDNNGILDYRGVYFYEYRPQFTHDSIDPDNETDMKWTYQEDNGYFINQVYWFNYDIITWYKNTTYSGENGVELFSALIIDSQDYNHFYERFGDSMPYEHNGGYGFENIYILSDIRQWLINSFYETAFNNEQKALLTKDPNSSSDGAQNDYVYLFSKNKAKTRALGIDSTAYARCQGYKESVQSYWTSTAKTGRGCEAYYVHLDSKEYYEYVAVTAIGVRPVIILDTTK
jgi:uncharacterized repeat protein (TIGR02543 family)